MVVAAADFYRYSEATGTPLPKSKKEEAQLAPAVNQWKKSRTSRNQNENNSNLGTAAAATAALAGIGATVLGLTRGKRPDTSIIEDSWSKIRNSVKAPDTATSTAVGGIKKDLNKVSETPVTLREINKELLETHPEEVTGYVKPSTETIFENINNKYPETNELYVDPRRIDKKESYRYSEGQKQADATTANLTPAQIEEDAQTILRTAEGEIPPGMQTPEQQAVFSPLSYIEDKGFVQPTAVDVAKLDDINVSQQAIENTNLNINAASNAGPQVGLDPEVTKVASSPITQAQLFLQKQRKSTLSALDENTKQSLELYAQTGDPETLKLLSEQPSLPIKVQTSGGEYDTNQFFDKTTKGEWVKDLESKDINLTNEISKLGKEKQDIAAYNETRLPQLEEDQNIARYAIENATTKSDEDLFLKQYGKLEYERNNLANPNDLNVDIGDAIENRNQVRREIAANKGLGGTYKLNIEKQSRPHYKLDQEGRIIPETVELRSEKFVKDTEPKGGGGRKVTAYKPDSQDLSTVGPYGIERANYPQSITSIAPSASPGSWTPAKGTAGNENVNIVISGSRDYTNYPEFVQKTDQMIREMNIPANKKITIVEGGAEGADKLGERYARERGYGLVVKPADWSKGGTLKYPQSDKSAGPRRNREMAEMGDVGIAFPGGKGTSNFVKTMAREEGKPVYYASEIQQATPESKKAMEASEEIRKIYSSGRPDAQQQVQAYIQGLRKGQEF